MGGLLWADNLILCSTSIEGLRHMARDATKGLEAHGLRWKVQSLEYMAGFCCPQQPEAIDIGPGLALKRVEQLRLLGVCLDSSGSTWEAMEHRMARASACFGAIFPVLCGPAHDVPQHDKVHCWATVPIGSFKYSSSGWHLCAEVLGRAWKWEQHKMRRVLCLHRRRPGEDHAGHCKRLTHRVRDACWKTDVG